jgi:hypothetical protein
LSGEAEGAEGEMEERVAFAEEIGEQAGLYFILFATVGKYVELFAVAVQVKTPHYLRCAV